MSCTAAVLQISEYVDGRLPDPEAAVLERHLALCSDCARLASEQRTLQKLARNLRTDPRPLPALALDFRPEVPEAPRPGRLHFIGWRRVAAAAVILVLTHLVAFEIGHDAGPVDGAGLGEKPAALEAGFVPERLRDHSAAARMLAGQIALMPSEAGEEASQLVDRQLTLLDAHDFAQVARNSAWVRSGDRRRVLDGYLASWERLNDGLRARLAAPGHTVAAMQQALETSGFNGALAAMELEVEHVRQGVWFRTREGQSRIAAACLAPRPLAAMDHASADAGQFLAAQAAMLRGNLTEASAAFAELQSMQHCMGELPRSSALAHVARYMQAGCLQRAGQLPGAYQVLASGEPFAFVRELKPWYSSDPVLVPLLAAAEHAERQPGLPIRVSPGGVRIVITSGSGMVRWVSAGCRCCGGH